MFSSGKHSSNPADTGIAWLHADNQQQVFVERSESGQIKRTCNCPKSYDLDHDQAETNIKLNNVMTRKRILVRDPEIEHREWLSIEHFKDEWLAAINAHQEDLIPIEEVENAKTWFEYLPKSPAISSRFRCKLCYENAEIFDIRPQHRSLFSEEDGVLYATRAKNRRAILDHASSLGHMKIVQ